MTKRLNNKTIYNVVNNGMNYLVVLERIHNDVNGHPRFKALVIREGSNQAYTYTFTGHYYEEQKEAEHIVEYMQIYAK